MIWMNECEIEDAAHRYRHHPILGPATRTLMGLVSVVNRNSDGWAYWRKPIRAAARLMEMIERDGTARYRFDDERADVSVEELRRAYVPLKTFRTTTGLQFDMHEPETGANSARLFDAGNATAGDVDLRVGSGKRRPRGTRAAPISLGLFFDDPGMRGSA